MWQRRYVIATNYDSYLLTVLSYEGYFFNEVIGKSTVQQDRPQKVNIAVKMRNITNILSHS